MRVGESIGHRVQQHAWRDLILRPPGEAWRAASLAQLLGSHQPGIAAVLGRSVRKLACREGWPFCPLSLSLSCLAEDSGNISVWGASSLLSLLPRCAGMQSVAVRRPDVIRAQRKASAYTTFPTHTQSPSSPTASLYPTSFDQLACRG